MLRKAFLSFWLGGLALFAVALALHLPLALPTVPNGILDHQSAGSAARVDQIHAAWLAAGVYEIARNAMLSDIVFIGVYGVGSVLGGWYFRRSGRGVVRPLGVIVLVAGVVFLVTDYGETVAQLIQLVRRQGSDGLAAFAAFLQPIKIAAWITTFIGMIVLIALQRTTQRI